MTHTLSMCGGRRSLGSGSSLPAAERRYFFTARVWSILLGFVPGIYLTNYNKYPPEVRDQQRTCALPSPTRRHLSDTLFRVVRIRDTCQGMFQQQL